MMELKRKDEKTKAIYLLNVTDNDAEVLEAVGYYHCYEEDKPDENMEVWKPKKK